MKKTLIALAALASVSAFAQSSVTISGTVAMGYQNSFGTKGTVRTDGNVNFTAVEDLGGGMKVTAVGGIDLAHRGQMASGRNMSLTLATANAGTFSMASVNANNSSRLGDAGGTISLDKNIDDIYGADVNIQSFGYTAPTFVKGLTLAVGWSGAPGSALTDTDDATGAAVAPGKITSASADYSAKYDFDGGNVVMTYRPDDKRARYGVNYSLAGLSFGAHIVPAFTKADGTDVAAQSEFEAWMPVGATTVGVQYGKRGDAKGTAFGLKYAFSKRTSIIASFAKIDDASGRDNTTQQRIKLNHSF